MIVAAAPLAGCGADLPERSQVFVVGADGSGRMQHTDDPVSHVGLEWSPDGDALLVGAADEASGYLLRVDAGSGEREELLRTGSPAPPEGAWSPRGDRVAALVPEELGGASRIVVADADGRPARTIERFPGGGFAALGPSWSPDGRRLAYVRPSDGPIRPSRNPPAAPPDALLLAPAAGGPAQALVTGARSGEALRDPRFSPAGEGVMVQVADRRRGFGRLMLAPLGPGPPRVLARDLVAAEVDWSPDGRTVAMAAVPAAGDRRYRLYLAGRRGGRLERLAEEVVAAVRPRFSPDGRRLAYIGGDGDDLRVRAVAGGQAKTVAALDEAAVSAIAWSPGGARIAFTAQRRRPSG